MQKDMHYYGTYAMALAAGIPAKDAATIAYAAQYTDDATIDRNLNHADKGFLYTLTTAHHPHQVVGNLPADLFHGLEDQRKMWVPFHFFPGGKGGTFEEKLLCLKDGALVREMLDNHLAIVDKTLPFGGKPYCLELMGIAAHVYADTFSHYGFSGMISDYNKTERASFKFVEDPRPSILTYIMDKMNKFFAVPANALALGHAAVATMPDRPYLRWSFNFVKPRPENGTVSNRDNVTNSLEACEGLHVFFSRFAKAHYTDSQQTPFYDIRDKVLAVLAFEGKEDERVAEWLKSGLTKEIPDYSPLRWEDEKKLFVRGARSEDGIDTHIYRFHQAAAYHRYYVLKDLLPKHGIAVY